ncbi:hypothetical protein KAR91_73005 [Candidatus Pacearchaeota archaeon]|nr:hypothetical protein [Candidatus Pacearchaeota archaeon]
MNNPRVVSARRARKLRKRGEHVKWAEDGKFLWWMEYKYLNRWKGDTARVYCD